MRWLPEETGQISQPNIQQIQPIIPAAAIWAGLAETRWLQLSKMPHILLKLAKSAILFRRIMAGTIIQVLGHEVRSISQYDFDNLKTQAMQDWLEAKKAEVYY